MGCEERSFSIPLRIDADASFAHVWAKSSETGGDGESLAEHTARLLRNIERMYERAPGLGQLAAFPQYWPCLAMAVAAHDLGKCAPGFQAMLRGGDRFP